MKRRLTKKEFRFVVVPPALARMNLLMKLHLGYVIAKIGFLHFSLKAPIFHFRTIFQNTSTSIGTRKKLDNSAALSTIASGAKFSSVRAKGMAPWPRTSR